ncbi:MAG: metal-dependent hydrolase [Polyangiaceae bacterium]|jgi:predicted metal-dependent hydrolase
MTRAIRKPFDKPPPPKRRIDFAFDPAAVPRDWYRGDAHLTTFWNALSLLFPEGERFFVEAVRRFRDRIDDPAQLAAIDGFVAQEAMHGRAHRLFNDMLRQRDLAVSADAEAQLRRLLAFARRTLSPKGQLAVTCALEHFTAILAEQLLQRDDHRDSGHASVQPLWTWHALEESEHKAVAYDVYEAVGGTYGMRVGLMLVTTAIFFAETANVHVKFLRADRELWNARGWAHAMDYLWVRPGLFRKLVPAYFDYFRPGFHPEDRDTASLLATWRERLFGRDGELRGLFQEGAAA